MRFSSVASFPRDQLSRGIDVARLCTQSAKLSISPSQQSVCRINFGSVPCDSTKNPGENLEDLENRSEERETVIDENQKNREYRCKFPARDVDNCSFRRQRSVSTIERT